MPVTTKRSSKVVALKERSGGLRGRRVPVELPGRAAPGDDIAAQSGDHVYRVIEIVGTSEHSVDDAIKSAVARASETLRHLRWFEVVRTSGHIAEGAVQHFQVTLKVGFTMEDAG